MEDAMPPGRSVDGGGEAERVGDGKTLYNKRLPVFNFDLRPRAVG